jgi:membrane protein DedA with SNARE-associated domain
MSEWSIVVATFLYCVGSAVIPLMHAEAYLITVSALTTPALSWAIVLAATAGQMLGKVAMYWAGRGRSGSQASRCADAWPRSRRATKGTAAWGTG